ncbi:hypothetical protein JW935_23285 [candidate division KSB1 bacterium]|nr:hypothetical protein [candidate division KSB1 bacterium]
MPKNTNSVDLAWHREQVTKFRSVNSDYKKYAEFLEVVLKKACEKYAPLAFVQTRPKSVSSFAEKAIRKAHKYKDPVNQITDLCGARIITHFQYQVQAITRFIRENFEIDEANSLDVGSRLKHSEFGYLSLHFIVTPVAEKILDITVPPEIKDKKAEIQVRTLLQHAWADISHDRIYKTPIKVPEMWTRESARLAAILENADDSFQKMANALDHFTDNYAAYLDEKSLDREFNMWKTLLKTESDNDKRAEMGLKLARVGRAAGYHEKVIDLLNTIESENPRLKVELGRCYCTTNRDNPGGNGFKKGENLLAGVAKPDQPVEFNTDPQNTKPEDYCRAKALHLLGLELGVLPGRWKESNECLQKAYQLTPWNPYYFADFLLSEILHKKDRSFLVLLRPAIIDAVEKCREHVRLGMEIPMAYFTLGRLWLIMDQVELSLNAYIKAIDLCIHQNLCMPDRALEQETAMIGELGDKKHSIWFQSLFHLARYLKNRNPDSKKYIESHQLAADLRLPLLIFAGGAEKMPDRHIQAYKAILDESLKHFEKTVISGGTDSGIIGWIGKITALNRKTKKYTLYGYLPKRLPQGVKKGEGYEKFYRTLGNDFSFLEVIQYWIDVIACGIDPANVLVLGVNGGNIAALEYRLALALGANVGLIESSGRAVAALSLDEDWREHPRLVKIQRDPFSVWAFVNQNQPTQLSDDEQVRVAPLVHKYYLEVKIREKNTRDVSMLPFDQLPDTLKKANVQQVAFIENVLNQVGYGIKKMKGVERKHFDDSVIQKMAEMEHARWCVERLNDGWRYGSERDDNNKIHPYIVPWKDLPDYVKTYDISAVKNFSKVLENAGYGIIDL